MRSSIIREGEQELTHLSWKQYEAYGERLMARAKTPGSIVSVAVKGKPVYTHAFGYRDAEKQLQATADTIFGIGSITKSFTAVAIMQLQEQGKLSVYDPVVRHLPEFGLPEEDLGPLVTLHHLMTHTSGLPPLPAKLGAVARSAAGDPSLPPLDFSFLPRIESYTDLLTFVKRFTYQVVARPGRQFSYSDEGYGLLGAVIERVSGEPYTQYVMDHIVKPAGMSQTSFTVPTEGDVTALYAVSPLTGAVIRTDQWWEGGPITSAGFLRSTVRDMLRYLEIFRTGGLGILSAESVREMMQPHVYVDDGFWYGYGLAVRPDYQGLTVIEHGGSVKGVSAHFVYMPEAGLTGAALANLQFVPTGLALLGALNEELGLPVENRWTVWFPAEAALPLDAYAGTYTTDDGVRMDVTVDGDGLLLEGSGLSTVKARLTPAGGHRFGARVREEDLVVNFLADEDRGVYGLLQALRVLRRV